MKTSFLVIIVVSIVSVISLSYYAIYDSSTEVFIACVPKYERVGDKCVPLKPEQYCKDWCDLDELIKLGCTEPAINHAFRYSNLLDDSFDGTYLINAIGYPANLSQEELDKCVKIILEKRLPSSHDYSFSRVNMTNACTDEPSVCYGTFANNTSIQVKCDFPIHGCSPIYYGISSTFSVMKDDVSFDVDYSIKGGTVKEMIFSNTANSLWVAIDSVMQGNLTLTIPRDLLDAKMDYCPPRMENSPDDKFFVLLDGEEIWYDEIKTTPEYRTLQISFSDNATKIEVMGTCFI